MKIKMLTFAQGWAPSFNTTLLWFLTIRFISAAYNNINDCDEVMNYWEPTHYLIYKHGFQTWEYSPIYALRSYLYILLHSTMGMIFSMFTEDKVVVFYWMRASLGIVCSICETFYYRSIVKAFGSTVGLFTLIFMLFSTGMFSSSTSFLPSTFTMYCFMLCYGCWFRAESLVVNNNTVFEKNMYFWNSLTVLAGAAGVLLGWPFACVAILPTALVLLVNSPILSLIKWGVGAVLTFLIPSILVDYLYYQKVVVAVYNIMEYNMGGSGGGGDSNLFGLEPWWFYLVNGVLNFNFLLPLSLLSLPLVALFYFTQKWLPFSSSSFRQVAFYLLPLYFWMGILSLLPHKEERFLYPVYPHFCLCAAVSIWIGLHLLTSIVHWIQQSAKNQASGSGKQVVVSFGKKVKSLVWLSVLLFILVSVSRTYALYKNYHAPLDVWQHLSENTIKNQTNVNVCVGKEWYRFPSHFFVPSSGQNQVRFLRSGFHGLLPKPFSAYPGGTYVIPTSMNNKNQEEMDRYVNAEECHYIVDFDFPSQEEEHYAKNTALWEVVFSKPFLDIQSSKKALLRAFYIPVLSDKENSYQSYYLLRNKVLTGDK
eukprot:TRINITY_DN1092_c0_g1_i4.p1 TRINITY_DN1092_c0_g1~~TRINITY_DN1092_c0_g1_i4.p1  ORF type:complete len:592 (-),score=89.77 TRINITY_DN1092_c0_g1_i4:127-1902(-)